MKLLYSSTRGLLVAAIVALTAVSCSEDIMDEINNDKNHPTDVSAKYILADVITRTAVSNAGGDINTYTAAYVEHECGTHNQLFRAEHRNGEPSAASTFNNVWGNIYTTLKNAKIVIAKCSAGGSEAGNNVTKGIAEVLAAYNLALLTDMFGDVPWTEACDINVSLTPSIDKQEAIYTVIMGYIDQAIIDLGLSDVSAPGSYDFIYAGNKAKWKKFAYGLKARYTMRLLKKSTNQTADLQNVISYCDQSFASASEQAAFSIYDASNLNPLFDYQWSRDGLAASQSMSQKLIARNDPRLRRVFVEPNYWFIINGNTDPYFKMAPNGTNVEQQYVYNTSIFVYSQLAPTLLQSYHEVLFLKAEALCRLSRSTEAEPVLKSAVVAAIANTEVAVQGALNAPTLLGYGGMTETTAAITATEAGNYFDTQVKPLFDANPLSETMVQKYIAFFGASGESTECYNDIRRMKALGENFVVLNNPLNATLFPLRLPYGNDDTTTNPNVQSAYGDGTYVYSEQVWWAGGTR